MTKKFSLALLGLLISSFALADSTITPEARALMGILVSSSTLPYTPPVLDKKAVTDSIIGSQTLVKGDIESLKKAQAEFTEEGAQEFLRHLDGFLDDKGTPTFTQTFTPDPEHELEINSEQNGMIQVGLRGIQKQEGTGTATYDGMVSASLDRKTLKIVHSNFSVRACAPTPEKPCGKKGKQKPEE